MKQESQRGNRRFWATLAATILIAVFAEYQFGDFLYDTQSATLTPAAIVLLVVGSSSLVAVVFLTGLQRFLTFEAARAGLEKPVAYSRSYSVIPLVRGILFVVIFTVGTLVALEQAGIDITPILAGAGVLGIAVGLGAQSLLRDILAGVFFVAEDSFRIGEYIKVGELQGTVERISLRSMKVRHHRGALHTIPYGQILSVSNYSRDWVIVKFELIVSHDTDARKLKNVVKQVSAEMSALPEYADHMLEPLKSQGIDHIDITGLTVRLKFMAVPGEQFVMRREMLRRLSEAFEANGIRLAKRSVHIEAGSSNSSYPAAAMEAIDEDGSTR